SPIDFSDQGLEDAEKSMERIYETMDRLDRLVPSNGGTIPDEAVLEEFRREMDEDFNTPRALAFIFDEIHALNRRLDEGKTAGLSARVLAMKSAGEVLGLFQEKAELFLSRKRERWMRNHGLSAQAIEELIQRRDRARSAKQWQEADRIRAELQERGITLEDTPGGTIWKVR
ncbi:MAG: DALR domain-containing protein, partial [Candidatus Binatota bacterium]